MRWLQIRAQGQLGTKPLLSTLRMVQLNLVWSCTIKMPCMTAVLGILGMVLGIPLPFLLQTVCTNFELSSIVSIFPQFSLVFSCTAVKYCPSSAWFPCSSLCILLPSVAPAPSCFSWSPNVLQTSCFVMSIVLVQKTKIPVSFLFTAFPSDGYYGFISSVTIFH